MDKLLEDCTIDELWETIEKRELLDNDTLEQLVKERLPNYKDVIKIKNHPSKEEFNRFICDLVDSAYTSNINDILNALINKMI